MDRASLLTGLGALLSAEDPAVTTLANAASFLYRNTEEINWLGFYRAEKRGLTLGPFNGKPACTFIAPGRGVCGAAVSADRLLNVADVHAFPGHIACDPDSRSELVVPLHARDGRVTGVLDIDSPVRDRFSASDEAFFKAAAEIIEEKLDPAAAASALTPRQFLDYLAMAERLKSEPRHCFTAEGVRETVAGHSWRMALMAMLLEPLFPALDTDAVIRMCLIHDLGEAVTGDIPSFQKTAADEAEETRCLSAFTAMLPEPQRGTLNALFAEMDALKTPEARFYKALDRLEAVIQHNESDIATWTAVEYELNRTYAVSDAAPFPWLKALRAEMLADTEAKIAAADSAGIAPADPELFRKDR